MKSQFTYDFSMDNLKKRHVIYVDDDANLRKLVELIASKNAQFSVATYKDAEDFLEHPPQQAPDVFLLDFLMPGMNGDLLYQKIKKIKGLDSTPVIFLSAVQDPQRVKKINDLGPQGIIPKPFKPMEIFKQIQEILETEG
jgi:DNA-binding response OmpR family regulator